MVLTSALYRSLQDKQAGILPPELPVGLPTRAERKDVAAWEHADGLFGRGKPVAGAEAASASAVGAAPSGGDSVALLERMQQKRWFREGPAPAEAPPPLLSKGSKPVRLFTMTGNKQPNLLGGLEAEQEVGVEEDVEAGESGFSSGLDAELMPTQEFEQDEDGVLVTPQASAAAPAAESSMKSLRNRHRLPKLPRSGEVGSSPLIKLRTRSVTPRKSGGGGGPQRKRRTEWELRGLLPAAGVERCVLEFGARQWRLLGRKPLPERSLTTLPRIETVSS